MQTLYLAGPIAGCSDAEARGWRDAVRAAVGDRFDVLDPMDRDYRGIENDTDPAAIVEPDIADIQSASVVLVRAERASWGTAMEIPYARQAGARVVVWCAAPVPSPWLRYHSDAVVPTLEEAIARVLSLAESPTA